MIPIGAIDPAARSDQWVRAFEYHLDLLPPVMDAIVTCTIPHIRANQTDKVKITGGGFIDNVPNLAVTVDEGGAIVTAGAGADATLLWGMVTEYVAAVVAWTWIIPEAAPPAVVARPDADPLTARRVAFEVIAWLIERAPLIEPVTQLDEYRDTMFTLIRHLRGRYGVTPHPRRPRARCATCGVLGVVVTWVDNPNGGPKPVRAGKCKSCGQTYTDTPAPATVARTAPREVVSPDCGDLLHERCRSLHCECGCHDERDER